MKTILLTALAAITMIASVVQADAAGPVPKNTTFKLKLRSISKAENNQLKPGLPIFSGAPKGLKVGKVYQFKIGMSGQVTGPGGINIAYASENRLAGLNLAYLKVPGAVFYADVKHSGTMNLNSFIEFGALYQKNNKGKPVSASFTYIDAKILPSLKTKQIVYVFEKP